MNEIVYIKFIAYTVLLEVILMAILLTKKFKGNQLWERLVNGKRRKEKKREKKGKRRQRERKT